MPKIKNKLNSSTKLNNNYEINYQATENKETTNNINDVGYINNSISTKSKNNETQIISKEDELKTLYYTLFKKKFNFWYFRWYKLTCRKKNRYFKEYEDFRIKIISEENLIKNHLNICNLLKVNEISRINQNFILEELVKE